MQIQPQSEKLRKVSKGRLHLITSCTECHKRKQKCDQEQPCRHCARRYPPPACIYPARDIAALQQQRTSSPQLLSYQGLSINHLPELSYTIRRNDRASSALEESPNVFSPNQHLGGGFTEKPPNDDLLEPLDVADAGLVYQKLLALMLSDPIPPSINADSGLARENSQVSNRLSENDFKHRAERLKWELWQTTNSGISRTCFGISSVEPLHYLPIKPTVLNGELLQIFVRILVKFVVSIDGNPSPNFYNDEWVPSSIKTPLLAQIAIYTASCYQSEARKIPAGKSSIALRHKLKSISLLNETLRNPEQSTCDEAIASVVYLTTNEWYWGSRQNVLAHLSGLKEMVRLRGGIEALDNAFLKKTTLLCDYHTACSFDIEPLFSTTTPSPAESSALCISPLNMSTPFLPSERQFAGHSDLLGIGKETASILDDMRFLLQAVIYQINANQDSFGSKYEGKLISTSIWIRDRISCLSGPADDFIYQSVRKAALIYCKAIVARTCLSRGCTLQDLNQLWTSMWRISLSRWKKTPGIFIFILLSANQAAQDTAHGRFLKSMLKSASFYVALENWEVIDGTLGAFIKLQRWLRERTFVEQMIKPLGSQTTDAQ